MKHLGQPRESGWRRVLAAGFALALVASACGGGGDAETSTSTAAPPDSTDSTETSSAAGEAAADLGAARDAVIQIVAEGGFVDPESLQQSTWAGAGTGFIISPDGLAVTNNHVVTGAALLRIYQEGFDRALNARVLGVSECNDLAVIDIEGDGYPYLEWYEGDITVGLPVYAAGYPLGEPQYTLVDGIVAKEQSVGEYLPWASIDEVIEHSADALPGNSGGPILDEEGRVVAVHFAGRESTGQAYAISREIALPVVEELSRDIDIDTIGINGEAYELDGYTGIWVSATASGSPADQALVQGGDLIITMEGQPLASDGSMADYCDILRSHTPTDTLSIEVYRPGTQEVLRGQLNGRPLEVTESLAAPSTTVPGDAPPPTAPPGEEVTWVNDQGNVTAVFPTTWGDVRTECTWNYGGVEYGPCLGAAENWDRFLDQWNSGGAFIAASSTIGMTPEEYLDSGPAAMGTPTTDCATYDGRYEYDDGTYVGYYDKWFTCGAAPADTAIVAAEPPDGSFLVVVIFKMVTDADRSAVDRVVDTFVVSDAEF